MKNRVNISETILNKITEKIIHCAIEVHKNPGPGHLESTYEACLEYELIQNNLQVKRQMDIPVVYKGKTIDCGYKNLIKYGWLIKIISL